MGQVVVQTGSGPQVVHLAGDMPNEAETNAIRALLQRDPPQALVPAESRIDTTGIGSQVAQGLLVDAPRNLASLGDLAGRVVASGIHPQMGGNVLRSAPFGETVGGAAESAFEANVGPVTPPQTPAQRRARAAAAGAGEALGTLPLGGGALPSIARRSGLEVLSGAAGELAASEAEAAGAGAGGQFAASLAAGMAPGTILSMARRGGAGVRNMATAGGDTPEAAAAAQGRVEARGESGVRPSARQKAAEIFQREVPDRTAAAEALQREIDRPGFGRASTPQILGDDAPGLFALEKSIARSGRSGRDLARTLAGIRRANAEMAERVFDESIPAGATGAAVNRFRSQSDAMTRRVRQAWANLGNIEGIPTDRIKTMRAAILADAGDELADSVPRKQLEVISRYGDTADLGRLRRLRSAVTTRIRGAARDPERAMEVKFLEDLKTSIDQTFDDVARATGTEDVAALQQAIALRAEKGRTFDPRLGTSKMFEFDDLSKGFRQEVLNSRKPVDEVNRLRLILAEDREAWAGIQRLMRDEVFGTDFSGLLSRGGVRTARGKLKRHAQAFDAVYGNNASLNAKRFLRRLEQLQQGVVGTRAEAAVSGSNVADFDIFATNASIISSMAAGQYRQAAIAALAKATGEAPKTMLEADILLAQAMIDPQIAIGLLEPLPRLDLENWAKNVQRFAARPTRSAAGSFGNQGSVDPERGGQR